jgi:SAM-dependent methyltransferase
LNEFVHNPENSHSEKRRRDFGIIGRAQQAGAADFVSRLPIQSGQRLLDVACGTGIASIPAARAGADVTGVDPREPFLSRGRAWAKNENLLMRFKPADLGRLPFSDGNFHVVLNFMGLPFAPDPAGTAREMQRVCRRRGLLAVTAWDGRGLVGEMLRRTYHYSGEDRLTRTLALFDPENLRALLADAGEPEREGRAEIELFFPLPPADVAGCFLDFHPILAESAGDLEPEARVALRRELAELWQSATTVHDGTTRAVAHCHELVIRRR